MCGVCICICVVYVCVCVVYVCVDYTESVRRDDVYALECSLSLARSNHRRHFEYVLATVSRIDKIISLFCRIASLL